MKPIKAVLIVLVVLLILGGGFFAYKNLSSSNNKSGEEMTAENTQEETADKGQQESVFSEKLADLANLGKNLKCTYEVTEEDVASSGTIYMSGKKMGGEGKVIQEGKTIESNFIVVDNTMYTWNSETPGGIMMKFNEDDYANNENATEETKFYQEKMDYKCLPWIVDESKFKVPSDIQFTDLTELTKTTENQEGGQNFCSLCNMMETEDQKAECLTQFNCE